MANEETVKPYGTVLIRAKDILDYLLASSTPPTLAEISSGLSTSKPTTLKILSTMDMLGLVRRDDRTKQYFIGTQLIAYAQKALASFDIAAVARPFLTKLRDETGETVNLGIVRDEKIVLIEKLESPNSIKLQSTVGGEMEMYCSAMGKAVLATYPKEQVKQYLAQHELLPMTGKTITSESKLQQNLRQVQQVGISVDNEENESDVFCLGATLRKGNQLFGAFSISTPKYRLPKERQMEFVRLLLNTQHTIENVL